MLRRAADLVDLGKFAGDHVGDDEPGMQADPDLEPGIAQAFDAPDQFEGGVAGQRRMIVIRDRRAEHGRQPVPQFLADDAAELAHGGPHRRQRGLEARHGFLGFKFGNEVRRMDHVGAKDRDELPFAVRILALLRRGTAIWRTSCRPRPSSIGTRNNAFLRSCRLRFSNEAPAGSPGASVPCRLWRSATDWTSRRSGCLWTPRSLG